jgi:SpoVK/Ycf46/Vps4 family AAA+-type ATPase
LASRREIFKLQLAKIQCNQEVSADDLAHKVKPPPTLLISNIDRRSDTNNRLPLFPQTEGYSGAEVVAICQEAALQAMEDDINAQFVSLLSVCVTHMSVADTRYLTFIGFVDRAGAFH